MIGRLRGVHVSTQETVVTIDVNGVGYEVQVTPRDLVSLPGSTPTLMCGTSR